MTELITRDMVASGYKHGLIRLTTDTEFYKNEIGVVCAIGDYWFYFGGEEAESLSVAEYKKNFSQDTIVDQIYDTLKDFLKDLDCFGDEYLYYYWYLKERLGKTFKIYEDNKKSSNYFEEPIGEMSIELLDRGIHVKWNVGDDYATKRLLYAEDLYKLLQLYDDICNSEDPYAYRVGKFAQRVLQESGADYDVELYPINI